MEEYSICHITSLHDRFDQRIFIREARSTAQFGYQVYLIVSDGRGDQLSQGVQIFDVGKWKSRKDRITRIHAKIYKKAKSLKTDIYQIHDPELYGLALGLRINNRVVIVDIHEDNFYQILAAPNKVFWKQLIKASTIWIIEQITCFLVTGIITASPIVAAKKKWINAMTQTVCAFPDLEEFSRSPEQKEFDLIYTGSVTEIRGVEESINAIESTDYNMAILGHIQTSRMKQAIDRVNAEQIQFMGFFEDRNQIVQYIYRSKVGLVTVLPTKNHKTTIAVKLFEYLAAGIPAIASDFPFWRKLLDDYQCVIWINPLNTSEIKEAIQRLLTDEKTRIQMGQRGRKAIIEKYNWSIEKVKMMNFYEKILSKA